MFMSASSGTMLMGQVCLAFVIMLNTLTGQLLAAAEMVIICFTIGLHTGHLFVCTAERGGNPCDTTAFLLAMTTVS